MIKNLYKSTFFNASRNLIPFTITKLILVFIDFIGLYKFQILRASLLRNTGAKLGRGTKICGGGFISCPKSLKFGEDVWLSVKYEIHVREGCQLEIGDNTAIAPNLVVLSDTHEIGSADKRAGAGIHKSVSIGKGVWVGANVTILPGISIGNGAVVSAGSVVTENIPDNVLAAGVPAKIKRELDV